MTATRYRLTQYAHGGGCACKIPPGELEELVRRPDPAARLGRPAGRPGRRRRRRGGPDRRRHRGRLAPPTSSPRSSMTPTTSDGSPPPTRCPTSTRWAAGRCWRSTWSAGRATCCRPSCCARCCAAASTSPREAGCPVAGGHSIDDPEPKYGMAVTGMADPDRLLRNDAARAGRADQPDQAARASACSTTGTRAPARCSTRRSPRW